MTEYEDRKPEDEAHSTPDEPPPPSDHHDDDHEDHEDHPPDAPKPQKDEKPETIGEPMLYDNEPNVRAEDQPAGPMTMAHHMGGKIFQRGGKRYEVLPADAVLCVDLENSEPKVVYVMKAPESYEYEPEDHA